jgi:hypothetical protein
VNVKPVSSIKVIMLNVHNVTKNVPNVSAIMKTVLDVTMKEFLVLTQLVHVKIVISLMLITIVKNVLSDV